MHSGCMACHNGPAAGGRSFQEMGVVEPYRTTNPAEGRMAREPERRLKRVGAPAIRVRP